MTTIIGYCCGTVEPLRPKQRHLLVRKAEHLQPRDVERLLQMMAYLPALATLRRFVVEVYQLFDPAQSPHQACCRRAALAKKADYQVFPDLVRALAMLQPNKFDKMIAYLHSPARQRVRTNNHVERVNRKVRYFEKVRYKWRRRRTIVRFVVLALDRWRQQWQGARQAETDSKASKPPASARARAS